MEEQARLRRTVIWLILTVQPK